MSRHKANQLAIDGLELHTRNGVQTAENGSNTCTDGKEVSMGIFSRISSRIKKMVVRALSASFYIVKPKRNRVCVIDSTPHSGSNCRAIYEFIVQNAEDVDVFLVKQLFWPGMSLTELWRVISSKVFVTSHSAVLKQPKNRLIVEAWHGFPLKAMNFLDNGTSIQQAEKAHHSLNRADCFLSSSHLYEVLMSACIGIHKSKFVRTGFPRNDYLHEHRASTLTEVLSLYDRVHKSEPRVITYMPTFRTGYRSDKIEGKLRKGNIFGFDSLDLEGLNRTLEEHNYVLVAKLHPMEEELVNEAGGVFPSRIRLMNVDWLERKDLDIYHVLAVSDVLITDYSSVYFDYLLLDRPIIFVDSDLEEYRASRGLLLEPYHHWTPGFHVRTQAGLEEAITAYAMEGGTHSEWRREILDLVYDSEARGCNCRRVWEHVIKPVLEL